TWLVLDQVIGGHAMTAFFQHLHDGGAAGVGLNSAGITARDHHAADRFGKSGLVVLMTHRVLAPHLIRHPETLHRLAFSDVLVENDGHIGFGHVLIPDTVRIHDNRRPHLAWAKTIGRSHDDLPDKGPFHHDEVELIKNAHGSALAARALGMSGGTGIFADKVLILRL